MTRYLIPVFMILLAAPACGSHPGDDDDDMTTEPGDDDMTTEPGDDDGSPGDDDDGSPGDDDDGSPGDDDDGSPGDDDDGSPGDDDDGSPGDDDDGSPGDDDDGSPGALDSDKDGSPDDVDCDDSDPQIYPGAIETCDGKDNDCDTEVDNADADSDGFSPCDDGTLYDCDDTDPGVNPEATEYCNGTDDDCDSDIDEDGSMDKDGDGFSVCEGDCRDDDDSQYPDITGSGWVEYLCNPVLPNTPDKDSLYTDQASVLYEPDAPVLERYKAWYRYGNDANAQEIAYATSPDGITWTKHGVVLRLADVGAFDNVRLNYPSVLVRDNGIYHMWYHGQGDTTLLLQIGYATSPDGMNWTRQNDGKPVLQATAGAWDDKAVQAPTVLWKQLTLDLGNYAMWYGGTDNATSTLEIGYATSSDGINWVKQDGDPSTEAMDPVLGRGDSGAWDADRITFPRVNDNGYTFEMYYAGLNSVSALNYEIGYASSTDGRHWTKLAANPVIKSEGGVSGSWRAGLIYSGSTLMMTDSEDREIYKMWFSGGPSNSGPFQTGLATNYQPVVQVLAPSSVSYATIGNQVKFYGRVDEPNFPETVKVTIESDLDGALGTATPDGDGYFETNVSFTTVGSHTVSVVAQDQGGLQSRDQVTVITAL